MKIEHVILDRDGVLNVEVAGGWVLRPERWVWEDGAQEALAVLAGCGVTLTVATNQSCVGRGMVDLAAIEAVHARMIAEAGVEFAGVFVCPHAPDEGCSCRKPEPGMLLQALGGTSPERAVFVGDSATDLEAARRAGVTPVLVRTGKGRGVDPEGAAVFDDLLAFAHVLGRTGTP